MINNEELLFCVDENNNPIEPKPRSLVHATGIWHRTSHIWIVNDKKEILCQRRSLLKDKAPGLWEGFFGGHIPPQVSYLNHALTELEEEVGLRVSKQDLKEAFVYKLDRGYEFVGVFILNWSGDETKLKLEPDEVDQVKWVSIEDFKKQIVDNKENWSVMGYEEKLFDSLKQNMEKTLRINGKLGVIVGDYIDCGENTPLVIITHGRGGHRNTGSKKIANYLMDFKISSLRIDLYGYGESDGKFEDITITTSKESILTALNYSNTNLKHQKICLFGTSYGGSGILGALDKIKTDKVGGLIFRCTILNYLAKTHREFSEQELNNWKERGYVDDYEGKLNYSFVEDMKNYEVIDYEKLSKLQTLYFYAGKDTKVLKSEVDDLKLKVGSKLEVITYPNSVHGIDIEDDFNDMLIKTKDFVLKHS